MNQYSAIINSLQTSNDKLKTLKKMADKKPKDNAATLYIIIRNDLDSMNPGKAAAQAAHASSLFTLWGEKSNNSHYNHWKSTLGFGRTITLKASISDIKSVMGRATNINSGIVLDPTYPIQDGTTKLYIPLETCGYFFTTSNSLSEIFERL